MPGKPACDWLAVEEAAVTGLPTGAVATFSKPSINVGETSTLSITTTNVAVGTFNLTLTGTADI